MNRRSPRIPRMRRRTLALGLLAAVLAAQVVPSAATELLPGFDEAIRVISEHLVGFSDIDPAKVSEGALRGVLSVVDPHASMVDTGSAAPTEAPGVSAGEAGHRTEVIADRFLYLGAARIDREMIAALEAAPVDPEACDGVILDLRTAAGTNLGDAAAFMSAFVAPGTRVFSVEGPAGESAVHYDASAVSRSWRDTPVVALIGPETGPAAEAAAGGLRDLRRAVLVGHSTPGGAVEREAIALPGGKVIHLATKRVRFPSGAVLFPLGAQPDVSAYDDEEDLPPLPAGVERQENDEGMIADVEGSGEDVEGLPPILPEPPADAPESGAEDAAGPTVQDDVAVRVAVDILKGLRALRTRP